VTDITRFDREMDHVAVLRQILANHLGKSYPPSFFRCETQLLGAVPELDSMVVVAVLTAMEEELGIEIPDDEIGAETFATFGRLVEYVRSKTAK